MVIPSVGRVELNQFAVVGNEGEAQGAHEAVHEAEHVVVIDLQEQLSNAAEEMADLLSTFGRFSKYGRRNDNTENDFLSAMLEDKADEKCEMLIKQVAKMSLDNNELLRYARNLFPNDSDLMLALRELLLSRRLSELQKKRIKEAIADLEKFVDRPKMQSGINVGRVAKRFSEHAGDRSLNARDLRASYLRFLELELPGSFIYQDWIEQYGCHNRERLLAFTLNALVADMKASEPGIQVEEFGPLSSKLSEARAIHTLDQALNKRFAEFSFRPLMQNAQHSLDESHIVALYLAGLLEYDSFETTLKRFNRDFMSRLLVKQRATVIQALRNIFNLTPEPMFADPLFRHMLLEFISSLLTSFHKKERRLSIWTEYYQ